MSNVRVGTAGFVVQRERYQSKLRFVEYTLRPPVPSPKVLAGWQRSAPEGFTFAAVAPDSLYGERDWPLRDPIKLQSELDRFANQVNALKARVVVLRTPIAVSPGSVALTVVLLLAFGASYPFDHHPVTKANYALGAAVPLCACFAFTLAGVPRTAAGRALEALVALAIGAVGALVALQVLVL
jgi:hypothetical protein